MSVKNIDKITFNGTDYDIPPVFRYYSVKSGDDYNAVSGYVMQWPNGLQIITGTYQFENMIISSLTGKWGSYYESYKKYMPHYDAEFKSLPYVVWNTASGTNSDYFIGELMNSSTTRLGQCYVISTSSKITSKRAIYMNFIAIGEWKTYEGAASMGNTAIENIKMNGDTLNIAPWFRKNSSSLIVKFSDGTMIEAGRKTTSGDINTASGSIYLSNVVSFGNFPEAFIETPILMTSTNNAATESMLDYAETTTTGFSCRFVSATSKTNVTLGVDFIAIGKWK